MDAEIRDNDIAIVGMACRFPGAGDVGEYWDNLVNGVESISFLSDDDLRARGVSESAIADPAYVKACPMIEDMEGFDAAFFGLTAREAQLRDPQGRLFLEACHTALDDAGYDAGRYGGTVGVFGGGGQYVYGPEHVRRNDEAMRAAGGVGAATATDPDYLATSVSYHLGLQGPSVTVQTACSTALVAIHLACQALRLGECDMALAGAVDVRLPYGRGHWRMDGGIASADGHVRAFDAAASGTVFGTGVGVLALKRLDEAAADGDHVHAVIRGSAVNNDGAARAGFTAPGVEGQTRLVLETLAVAEVGPETIGYVEAHGTGTLVGDPIEVTALTNAFRAAGAAADRYCVIGSVKPNVGHLGAAAGAAGIIKACLAVETGLIPPTLHFETPNPDIDFDTSPFRVATEVTAWEGRRRAGVSSFGIGGTNAHIVLERPPAHLAERPPGDGVRGRSSGRRVLPLSARTPAALRTAAGRLAEHLRARPGIALDDVALTLQRGRRELPYRRAVTAASAEEAAEALEAVRDSAAAPPAAPGSGRGVALLFPGQGSQYPGMGRGLYRTQEVFRREVDRCCELLLPHLGGTDLRDLLYPDAEAPPGDAASEDPAGSDVDLDARTPSEVLSQTRFAQPALFVVEYALAALYEHWGVVPEAMLGHSVGEYTAACRAGVFALEDALALVAARGELMQGMPPGGMLAVPLPERLVRPMLFGGVDVAAVNSPGVTVVAGPWQAVEDFEKNLAPWGVRCQRLTTSHAFHTGMMDPILEPFRARVAAVAMREPSVPFLSNVTGTWITSEQATDPGYWAEHLRGTVRFADCLAALTGSGGRALLETGPGRTLTTFVRQMPDGARTPGIGTMRHPLSEGDDEAVALEALGRLWAAGVAVDWPHPDGARRTPLPAYPYERQRFWLEPDPEEPGARPAGADSDDGPLPVEEAVFKAIWEERPLPPGPAEVPPDSRWLVLSPGGGPVAALAALLAESAAQVTTLVPGDEFARSGPEEFTVRAGDRGDYEAVLEILGREALPTHVVHGWTATPAEPAALDDDVVAAVAEHGFYSLLHLAQALDMQAPERPVRILAVTTNMQEVSGGEPIEPAKALLLGPSLLITRELGGIDCRSVDLTAPSMLPPEALAGLLLREALAEAGDEQVAWRGLKRWAWSFAGVPVETPEEPPAVLREGGAYLVTGGLGGIGLMLAEDLFRTCRARLVLIGRSGLPARAEWGAIIAGEGAGEGAREGLRERLERLAALESAGAEIIIRACDVTDEAALAAVVGEAVDRYGRVDGVFHLAGVAGGGMLSVRAREDAERVLAPKVAGTLALHRLLGDRTDFMVLFSSISSVVGDFGLVDYCAANNFMDAFARRRSALGERVMSISWTAWRGAGMAVDAARVTPEVFRELRQGQRSEPVDHPLLSRRIADQDGDVFYSTVLGPDSHWVLTDHRIRGVPVLPGSAGLEMMRAAVARELGTGTGGHAGPDDAMNVELSDVLFTGPVAVPAERELRVVLKRAGDGFDITVRAADAAEARPDWAEHIRAHGRLVPATPPPVLDIAAAKAECTDLSFEPEPGFVSRSVVEMGPHWYNVKQIAAGHRRQYGLVVLPEEFRDECGQYVLHPGLFDDAVSNARVLKGLDKGFKYLPFGYRRIVIRRPLPTVVHVQYRELDDGEGEIAAADLSLMAPDGTEVVAIEEYALRRMDPDDIYAATGEPAPGPGLGAAAGNTTAEDAGGGTGAVDHRPSHLLDAVSGMRVLRGMMHGWAAPHLVVSPEGLEAGLRRVRALTGDVLEEEIGKIETGLGAATGGERPLDTPYAEPETPRQKQIAGYWTEAFGIRRIGLDDDFAELGGNSLMAVQLAWRIRQELNVEITVARLFRRPTVRTLADLVEQELAGARTN
ncbi:type I polyketide synthase [Actinomadura fibrosa]|uniref:SDR family NAD(P)-dependent oxidoreductase n=1 Tax=Actinomadura fibrosa TaxID=111802 RepID=A0ABW2XL13_9ACTN|nr:type I polyketide synthase [Actinomadura fibrosa]